MQNIQTPLQTSRIKNTNKIPMYMKLERQYSKQLAKSEGLILFVLKTALEPRVIFLVLKACCLLKKKKKKSALIPLLYSTELTSPIFVLGSLADLHQVFADYIVSMLQSFFSKSKRNPQMIWPHNLNQTSFKARELQLLNSVEVILFCTVPCRIIIQVLTGIHHLSILQLCLSFSSTAWKCHFINVIKFHYWKLIIKGKIFLLLNS